MSWLASILPLRIRSKAVSKSWVKAATRSKPNIAPEPLIVCSARKAASIRSRSCGVWPRSSSTVSRLSSRSAASWRKVSVGIEFHHALTSLATTASSCSGLNGLVIQPGGAGGLGLLLDGVVGFGGQEDDRHAHAGRQRAQRPDHLQPFITGMLRSVMTRSKRCGLGLGQPFRAVAGLDDRMARPAPGRA